MSKKYLAKILARDLNGLNLISLYCYKSKLKTSDLCDLDYPKLKDKLNEDKYLKILNNCQDSSIYQLFPYSSPQYNDDLSLEEVKKSSQNLNTRLSNLKKINKSLDEFEKNSSQLNWNELKKINRELSEDL